MNVQRLRPGSPLRLSIERMQVAPPARKRKKPAGASPTQLTLRMLREQGYLVAICERWNPFAKIRQDLFGIVDVLAIKRGETLAVQTTSDDNVSHRINKIADHESTPWIREAGWRFLVHGWKKKDGRWVCREVDVS